MKGCCLTNKSIRDGFMFTNQPSPKALPMPNAAPEAKAPIRMVSPTEMYHIMPPTQLLASPNTPKKKAAVQIVAITTPESRVSMP